MEAGKVAEHMASTENPSFVPMHTLGSSQLFIMLVLGRQCLLLTSTGSAFMCTNPHSDTYTYTHKYK